MTEVREKKRKLILVSVTFILCISIMLTGTFAWSSLGQSVINETMGEMTNPGGRLHDDFNGSNKDIYVENFTAGTDGMDIIVRIRLSEYMEIGPDAGINRDSKSRNVNILTMQDTDGDGTDDAQANIKMPSTWDIVSPMNDNHYGYWSWGLGGQTVYLPTLDTDTSSDSVDRNGTYEGKPDTSVPFDDYQTYIAGEDYGGRTAKTTIDGTVMNMDYWLMDGLGNKELGNYWVYDADGWAYWANPLSPQEATGLLLSKISHSRTIEDKWYYAINVECQMVTVDEIGNADNEKGFYSEDALTPPSDSARWLLDALIKEVGYVELEAGTYGMYTADISDEELQMLLGAEETEKEAVKETEETDLEDLTEPDETEENKEENEGEEKTDDKEPSDEDVNEDDTSETEGGGTTEDTTPGTESGDTTEDTTPGTESGDTTEDTTPGTECGNTIGDTTPGTENGDTTGDTTSGTSSGDTTGNTTSEAGTSTGKDTPLPTTEASDMPNTVNGNVAETKSTN